jgi:non-heme chloroperoxidase
MGGFIVAEHLRRGDAPAAVLMASVPPEGLLGSAFGLVSQNPDFFNEINIIHHVDPRFATLDSARQALFSEGVAAEVLERAFAHMQPESQRAIYDLSWPWFRGPWRLDGTPALVLGGEQDAFFPPAMVESTAAACGTTAEIFPGMAHAMMLEPGWRKVADRILRWLDDLGI